MKYNKAIAQARSMLERALNDNKTGEVANLTGLLMQLQKDYIYELERKGISMMPVWEVKLGNGKTIEIGARTEGQAKYIINRDYGYHIMSIRRVR